MSTSTAPPIHETWKPVVGYDGVYSVSDLGRVRIDVTRLPRKAGELMKIRSGRAGLTVGLSKDGVQRNKLVCTLVLEAFGVPRKGDVHYVDGDPENCALSNLTFERPRVSLPAPVADDELFRPVADPRYCDFYEVSNYGRIFACRPSRLRERGGILKPSRGPNGYASVNLSCPDHGAKSFLVHRIVAEAFIGACPGDGWVVDHINRDRTDARASNLRWVTTQRNNPYVDTSRPIRCTLSHDDAAEIRRLYAEGARQVDLADRFGVTQNQISMVVLHKSWAVSSPPVEKRNSPMVIEIPSAEVWRECPSYPGYSASSMGRVKCSGYRRSVSEGYVYSPRTDDCGYLFIQQRVDGKVKNMKIHRMVADAFIGPANGLWVNHIDGNRANNCATNLEYVTAKENCRHRFGYAYRPVVPAPTVSEASRPAASDSPCLVIP